MFDALPVGFRPSKPSDIDEQEAADLLFHNLVIAQRKRDGQNVWAMTTSRRDVRLYSTGGNEITNHLPILKSRIESMRMPPHSMLSGEFIVDRFGADSFEEVGSVLRSLPERAAQMEAAYPTQYYVFDVLYWNGSESFRWPYRDRYQGLRDLKRLMPYGVTIAEELEGTWTQIRTRVIENRWEGVVLWMLNEPATVRFDDHCDRRNCYRWKPVGQDEFVCTGFEWGKGKHAGRVGALKLAQYENGVLKEFGTAGTGLTDVVREQAMTWQYPVVIEVRYQTRWPNGMMRFPRFVRLRPDKPLRDCIRR